MNFKSVKITYVRNVLKKKALLIRILLHLRTNKFVKKKRKGG